MQALNTVRETSEDAKDRIVDIKKKIEPEIFYQDTMYTFRNILIRIPHTWLTNYPNTDL
jgi:hypothetical protein